MGRRNNGEGSIQKRKDGRWCGRYTVNGKRKYVYGKTRKEVAEKLFRVISESKAGFAFDFDDKILLKNHMSNWLEYSVRASVGIRTYERREEISRLHIIPSLGETKLKDLSQNQVQWLYREKLDSGLSPRSVNHIHCTLNKALNEAVRWGVIPHNVWGAPQGWSTELTTEERSLALTINLCGDCSWLGCILMLGEITSYSCLPPP